MKIKINFNLNNEDIEHYIEPNRTLLNMIREDFDLTGAKEGCGAGECGACTILVDGKPINACLVLAVEVDGKEISTIEGLSKDNKLDELQASFIENAALQCGYCTPGMVMTAKAFLKENDSPTKEEVKKALSGNLCRCTGYKKIVEAVMDVVEKKSN